MDPLKTAASLAVLALAAAPAAYAQSGGGGGAPPGPAADDLSQPSLVEELVVTAQKREQSLQDVPIVVTAVGEQLLQDAGVRDIKDLMLVTPGLMVNSTANESNTVARIRGVGTIGDNPGLESSVGIVIDGVYRPRASTGIGDLGELTRVEVLKGPQGTLFGKNTSAGVINVITAAPEYEFSAEAEATVGNFDAREATVSVTGSLVEDVLAGRLYVAGRKRDGFYQEVRTGLGPREETYDNDRNYYTIRGQLLWEPHDDVSVRAIADFTHRDEICCAAVTVFQPAAVGAALNLAVGTPLGATTPGTPIPATLSPIDPESRIAYANREGPNDVKDQGVSVEVNWDTPWLGNTTLTSITAVRNWRTEIGQEADFSAADLIYRLNNGEFSTEFRQFSQELRYAGEAGRLNWLVGFFYADEDLDQSTPLWFGEDLEQFLSYRFSGNASPAFLANLLRLPVGQVFPAGGGTHDLYAQNAKTAALFTNNSYALTDQLELTIGLRYTMEEKTLDAQYRNVRGNTGEACSRVLALGAAGNALLPAVCATFADPGFNDYVTRQERENEELTGTVKLAYRFNPDLLTYVSYAHGYKSGGYNLDRARFDEGVPNPDTFFPAEYVDAYELGAKTTLMNGDLIFNAALFHQTFEGFQLNTYTGISYIVSSIPEVISRGVDTDLLWRTPLEGLDIQGGLTYAETQYGDFVPGPGVSPRLPNTRVSGAPLYSASLAGTYDRPINEAYDFHANVNVRYVSSYNTGSDLNPIKVQDGFALVNARVGFGPNTDRWRLELWGANLTDEVYSQVIFDPAFQTGAYNSILSPPRTYGVTLRLSY